MRSIGVLLFLLMPSVPGAENVPVFISAWGAQAGRTGQFVNLTGVAVSPTGFIYAADNDYIRKFDADGYLVGLIDLHRRYDYYGTGTEAAGLSVSPDNFIYWPGRSSNDLNVYWCDSTGTTRFGGGDMCCGACIGCGGCMPYTGTVGIDARTARGVYKTDQRWGQICGPTEIRDIPGHLQGVAVDAAGNVFVTHWKRSAEESEGAVRKYGSDGALLGSWSGSPVGVLIAPRGIAVDRAGRVYVVDSGNSRIQVFSNDGHLLMAWGSEGSGPGQFSRPDGIAVDAQGNIYVADRGNRRIQKFGSVVAVEATSWSDVRRRYR